MDGLKNILEHSFLRETNERKRSNIINRFPELKQCPHKRFLSLNKYIVSYPQKFFSYQIYIDFFEWLKKRDQKHTIELKKYFSDHSLEIDRAIMHLEEINNYDWHDNFETIDEFEQIRFIDKRIHPPFLRLTEAVLAPFLRAVAYFSRIDRNSDFEGLDIWNIIEEIRNYTKMDEATKSYNNIIRNAIAHGGITYLQGQIIYRDKKGNEEIFDEKYVINKFDDLLDTCNALSAAISVFYLSHHEGYSRPQQLLIEELRAETEAPWWEIVWCIDSRYSNLNQLMIYARPSTSDVEKVRFSTFQSGVLAEFFAPGYDRYFFSIKSAKSWQGFASFDGKELYRLRKKEKTILEDYKGVMSQFFFNVPGFQFPQLIRKFENWLIIFRSILPNTIAEFKENLKWPDIFVREAKIHRNGWRCVVNGSVYISATFQDIDQKLIRKFHRRIISNAYKVAQKTVKRTDIDKYLPLGYASIAVFQKDYRRRRLQNFGLDQDLICTLRFQKIRRIKSPDIFGSTIEQLGKYRIAWNKAWLESKIDVSPQK